MGDLERGLVRVNTGLVTSELMKWNRGVEDACCSPSLLQEVLVAGVVKLGTRR